MAAKRKRTSKKPSYPGLLSDEELAKLPRDPLEGKRTLPKKKKKPPKPPPRKGLVY